MNDVVIRKRQEVASAETKNENIVNPEVQTATDKTEVPYTEFEAENGVPYTAKYYSLGDKWEAFGKEIQIINDYINEKINKGEIANSIKAVESEIRKIEKLHDLKDEERAVIKIGITASYIKFLNETDYIKMNTVKYG